MKAVKVTAINGEDMILPAQEVRMVGPLMDRGMAVLGRSVLYIEGFPPLPVKNTRDDIAALLGWEVVDGRAGQDPGGADGADEPAAGGQESRLVV